MYIDMWLERRKEQNNTQYVNIKCVGYRYTPIKEYQTELSKETYCTV
jgi:hypothetical protein